MRTQRQRRSTALYLEHLGNQLVDRRDAGDGWTRCVACGSTITGGDFSRQHRKPRGMGGSTNDPTVAGAANKITLCGSATTGCHGWVEANPIAARLRGGWALDRTDDPLTYPVLYMGRWALLDNEGGLTRSAPPLLERATA